MKYILTILILLYSSNVYSLGWTKETKFDGYVWSSCVNWPKEQVIDCVYHGNINQHLNGKWNKDKPFRLYETISYDGGITWNTPSQSIQPLHDTIYDYSPYMAYDRTRNRMWMTYNRNAFPQGSGNAVILVFKRCVTCKWEGYYTISPDIKEIKTFCKDEVGEVTAVDDYWQSNILITRKGTVLVSYNRGGPEGQSYHVNCPESYGKLFVVRWNEYEGFTTRQVSNTGNAEFLSMRENSNGDILGVFTRYSLRTYLNADWYAHGLARSDLHQIWSADDGKSWIGESILLHDNSNMIQPFIGIQQVDMSTKCKNCSWTILYGSENRPNNEPNGVYLLSSLNEGLTWSPSIRISEDKFHTIINVVPSFTIGCRGPFMTYSQPWDSIIHEPGHKIYTKRYDWVDSCILK